MTILGLILLIVFYVAVVSAPISMSFARLSHRELPPPRASTTVRSGEPKRGTSAAATNAGLNWLPRDCPQLFGTKMYMSKEKIMEKRWHFQSSKRLVACWLAKVGYAVNAHLRALARFEWFRPWYVIVSINRNYDGDTQASLISIRIPIDRPRYR